MVVANPIQPTKVPQPAESPTVPASLPQEVVDAARAVQIPLADPVSLAESASSSDPRVVEWLKNWQVELSTGRSLQAGDRLQLESTLESSPLGWQQLFQIGRAYRDIAGDAYTASAFFRAAVTRADRELHAYSPGAIEAQPILIAMNDARRLLWDVIDNIRASDLPCLRSLALIGSDIIRWAAPDNLTLADARNHAMISVPECMFAMGDEDHALPLLLALDTSAMTENERLGVAWLRGRAFLDSGQFAEAAKQFRVVAADPGYQYAKSAFATVVISLHSTGQTAAAEVALDDWIRRYRPNAEEVANIFAAMRDREVATSGPQ